MPRTPADEKLQRIWDAFEAARTGGLRSVDDDNSKLSHITGWVMKKQDDALCRWAALVDTLDPKTGDGGIARYIAFKRKAPSRPWTREVSAQRGLGVFIRFFDFAAAMEDADRCKRIVGALKDAKRDPFGDS